MNPMTDNPPNMTRVLLTNEEGVTLEFGYFKDGMYKSDSSEKWQLPKYYGGRMSIQELKFKIM